MRRWRPIFEVAMLACGLGGAAIFAQERGISDTGGYVVADGTVVHDPAEAFAAEIAATLAGNPRNQQLRRIVERWATEDPAAAAFAIAGVPKVEATRVRGQLAEITGRLWATQAPDAAIDWATTRTDDAVLRAGVILGLAAIDPERALAVAARLPDRDSVYTSLAIAAIAADDPVAAAEYWQRAGFGEANARTVGEIAKHWAARDPAAAQLWVLGLPAGWGRDTALLTIVNSITSDSAHAAEIVNRIQDERVRSAAAMNWVQNARARGGVDVEDFRARVVLSPASKAELDALLPR